MARLWFFSGTHPDVSHISGVRAASFAREGAKLGHRCVLLAPSLPGRTDDDIATHDWSTPYVATFDEGAAATRAGWLGKATTAANMLRYGGNRVGLYRGLTARARTLVVDHRPDAIWTTFGSLEAVFAARTIARVLGIPWLLDIKDNAATFVPAALRPAMARRVAGSAALQANSQLHAEVAARWLGRSADVVYSGVDHRFFERQPAPVDRQLYVTLAGGLYRQDRLDAILAAIADHNRDHTPLRVVHLGSQGAMIADSGRRHGVEVYAPGYVDPAVMASYCQSAIANLYVFAGHTFHHKLLELLACRRPVIAYGGELPESRALARELHAPLTVAEDGAALRSAIARVSDTEIVVDSAFPERFFTWPDQARKAIDALVGMAAP